jgi:hypothetical protein
MHTTTKLLRTLTYANRTVITEVPRDNYNWVLQHVPTKSQKNPLLCLAFLTKRKLLENKNHYKQIKW